MTDTHPDRRSFLATSIATLIGAGLRPTQTLAAPGDGNFVPLGRVAAEKGLKFGFAVNPRQLVDDPHYAAVVAKQATIVVPENALKWETVHPASDRFDFTQADTIADFTRRHGIAMRGHTFCWHRSLPSWVTQSVTKQNAEAVLVDHIHRVAGHYKGTIQSWDVANEAINPSDGLTGDWRNSFWYRTLGPSYIEVACRAAREADPTAVLCYNDYGLEGDGASGSVKRKAVLAMLRTLLDRGVPIGAVGIQSHLRAGRADSFGPGLARFLLDLKALGLAVYITELDVDDSGLDPASSNEIVAGVYKRYLDLVLETGAVSAILTWGVWDTPHYTAATPGQSGPMAQRPLLFGPGGSVKDASWAAEHSLMRSPSRALR